MKRIEGATALITGAGSGIGRATAIRLGEEGARLIICDVDPDGLAETAGLLGARCVDAELLDVGDRPAYAAYAERVLEAHGPPTVLVNNAGVGLAGGMLDTPLSAWDWLIGVNLWGVVHGCHFFAPAMAERGSGHIVNVASMLGWFAIPRGSAYCTSKFAVIGLTESLRLELAPRGVGVSAICPGMVQTNIIARARIHGDADPEGQRAAVLAAYAKRNFPPEKVATAVVRAIRRDRGVVPVTLESHVSGWLKRFAPGLAGRAAQLMERVAGK